MKNESKSWWHVFLSWQIMALCMFFSNIPVSYAQSPDKITVAGCVKDAAGDFLIGATVQVKGISGGTITDIDGNYILKDVPRTATLVFSYVGMQNKEVPVNGKSTINVTLLDDALQLEQVVVIGYGSVKKSDVTGSVTSVKTEALKEIPANSVEGLLQGRAAGLQVINSSQDPGAGATVRIRGGSSLRGSNAPLVVVDGFPLGDAGDLKQINPSDIVNMEILKDASASAIYGSRGANGVIMITTKRAKTGTTNITVRQQITLSQFDTKLDLWRDPVLMASLNNESRINGGLDPLYVGKVSSTGVYYPSVEELQTTWTTNTRWDDLVFRDTPVSNNTTATISSSNDRTVFNLSANFYTDNGMYIKDDYTKGGYNLSVDHNIYDSFKVRFSNILSRGVRNANGGLSYWRNPIYPVYDENGDYYLTNASDFSHPMAITDLQKNETKSLDVISSVALEWQLFPFLKLTSQLNYKFGKSVSDRYYPKKYTEAGEFSNGQAEIENWEGHNLVSETFANFQKKFDKHDIGAMVGYSYEYYMSRSSGLTGKDFVNEALGNENMGAGNPEKNEIWNGYSDNKLVSGMFRLNYVYDNKYLLTLTARADGSSKFGKNNKWAMFPSGAVSWKAHEESFIKNLNVFDELKFRFSYGISGNQGISPYQTLSRYGTDKYYNDGSWATTIGPGYVSGWTGPGWIYRVWSGIPNPDLKWETTAQTDFGIDMAFLNRRLRVSFDYYDKQTSDLLRERNLALSSGYDKMWVNDGKIQNRGFEVTVDADILQTKDWQLSGTLIYSRNRNKVKDLGNTLESGLVTDPMTGMLFEYSGNSLEQYRDYTNILAIGQPVNVFYGYKVDGIVQTLNEGIDAGLSGDYANPGEFKYMNLNGDSEISEADKTIIGDPNPDFTASLALNLSWKKFDVSVFLNGVFGQDVLNTKAFGEPSNSPLRWTPDNPTNKYPSLRDGRQVKISDWWIEDGSFLRVQNLNIGYTFDLPKKSFLSKARIYMNASNLYTFTKFKGYDPEVGLDGVYSGGYPRLRKWTFGLDLTF
ncbi:SusC/RagA family TonB-linked outer membrane protein [Bacteroides cellulosilyticus]|jgi:tonB-linked outer membrane protein, susC/ragA family|uniref:SusC/RagA family TonB-linked outer membrane protein n=1 Tax=Bacteroides cellulosilyticus TaxID=246787 RepID=UPI000E4AF1A7|nr:TonB-dependent receptor [Bacteroides cellulosilyticus]RGU30527.1 TonB-dependent receptor [Bacteroides cellulosilyticus]